MSPKRSVMVLTVLVLALLVLAVLAIGIYTVSENYKPTRPQILKSTSNSITSSSTTTTKKSTSTTIPANYVSLDISNNYNLTNATTPSTGNHIYTEESKVLINAISCYQGNCMEGFVFENWNGIGEGNYTGPSNSATISMNGNIDEIANYRHLQSTTTTTSSASTSSTSTPSTSTSSTSTGTSTSTTSLTSTSSTSTSTTTLPTTSSISYTTTVVHTTQYTTTINPKQSNVISPTGNDQTSNAITVPYNVSSNQTNTTLKNNYSIEQKSIIAEVASHENTLYLIISILAFVIIVLIVLLVLDLRKKVPKNPGANNEPGDGNPQSGY